MKKPVVLGIAGGLVLVFLASHICSSFVLGAAQSYGSVADGYVLVAPYRVDAEGSSPKGEVHLMNRQGIRLHTWRTEAPVLVADLKDDGTLYVSMTPEMDHRTAPGWGTTGILQRLGWNGEVLWEHRDPLMTIDFEVLPGGSVAYLRWEETSEQYARSVFGGYPTGREDVFANEIVVVSEEGEETWVWRLSEHVSPSALTTAFAPRQDFAHANSIRYVAENPLTKTPAFLISVRHLSTIFLIDAEDGDVLWQSPQGVFSFQHDATFTKEGTLLAFDNGFGRAGISGLFSRALEIDPVRGSILWSYDGGTPLTAKALFASSIMGGAERLLNGNTFITLSTTGTLLEVTPEGEVAWEYKHMARDEDNEQRILFRSRVYDPQGTEWGGRLFLPSAAALVCRS